MSVNVIIISVIVVLVLALIALLMYFLLGKQKDDNLDALMSIHRGTSKQSINRTKERIKKANDDVQNITEAQRRTYKKNTKDKITQEERLYHAGLLSADDRARFKKIRIFLPIALLLICSFGVYFVLGKQLVYIGVTFGCVLGYIAPSFYLDYLKRKRYDAIMYYLPLVIEQLAIGVSSSLDIGPCLQRVIQMADERDSHNEVTELIYHTERYLRTGVSLEEALIEVGTKSGHPEVKHAFIALSQVAKHGGEISHQLQELANAVSSQRETQIEAKIKKLELAATGPVGLVFVAFISTLGVGIVVKLKTNL